MSIINVCCLIILVIMTIAIKKRERELINPLIIFYSVWSFVLILHSMGLYGLYQASEEVYSYIYIGLIAFGVGYYCINIFKSRYTIVLKKNKKQYKYKLRYILVYIIGAVCIIFFLKNFLISLQTLLSGNNLATLRNIAQDESSILNSTSGIKNLIYNFIVLPSATVIEVVAVVDFWFGKKDRLLFFMNIVIIIMRIVSDAGRTPIFNFALYMICCYLLSKKISSLKSNNKKLNKKTIKRYGFLGVIFLSVLTISRSGALFIRHFYFYFAMAPYMFNHWINVVDQNNILAYGTASMNGYVFSFFYFIKNLINSSYPEFIQQVYDLIVQTDSVWIGIAPGSTAANAYVSAFWFFYLDGKIIGIIIGMFLYGAVVTKIYLLVKRTESVKDISLYIIMVQGLVFSFIRFPFAKSYFALAVIMIMFIVYEPFTIVKRYTQ